MPKLGPTISSTGYLVRAMSHTEIGNEPHGPAVRERQRELRDARRELRKHYANKHVLATDAAFTQVKHLETLLLESIEDECAQLQFSSRDEQCGSPTDIESKLSSLRLRDRGRNIDFSAGKHVEVSVTPMQQQHVRGRRRVSGEGQLGIMESIVERSDGPPNPRRPPRAHKKMDGRSETVMPRRPPPSNPSKLTHSRAPSSVYQVPVSRSTPAARPPSRAAAKLRNLQESSAHEQAPTHAPLIAAMGHALQQAWASATSPEARRPPKTREAKTFSATKLWDDKGRPSQSKPPHGTALSSSSGVFDQSEELEGACDSTWDPPERPEDPMQLQMDANYGWGQHSMRNGDGPQQEETGWTFRLQQMTAQRPPVDFGSTSSSRKLAALDENHTVMV